MRPKNLRMQVRILQHTIKFRDDFSKQLFAANIWQAVQLGTVVEIGVRFPAIPQHPVLLL